MFEDSIDLIVVTTGEDGTQGPRGEKGNSGEAATIVIGETLTSVAGSAATVTNLGNPSRAVLQFNIPRGVTGDKGEQGLRGFPGDKGNTGDAASVEIGNVTFAQNSDESGSIINVGDQNNAVLDFYLPRGLRGERGLNGPQGVPGSEATIEIGEVTTVSYSTSARVVNKGTTENSILDFWIPSGANGPAGKPGTPGIESTIEIGKISGGDTPKVNNVGTETNAILDFVLPTGPQGLKGDQGNQGTPAPHFTHNQENQSASWSIDHNLGHMPTVSIYILGELVEADVVSTITSTNISFPTAVTGIAVFN